MVEIVFLGTGSVAPTAKRSHPSILLKYKAEQMLFDCGEGTQRQFRLAKENPCKLTKLFISHWHGDHILGIPGLLQTLALSGYQRKLEIYGPKGTKSYMQKILDMFLHKKTIDYSVKEVTKGKIIDEEDYFVEALPMDHGAPCLAYRFVEKDVLRIDKKKIEKLKIKSGPEMSKLKKGKDVVISGKKLKAKDFTYPQRGKKVAIVTDTGMNANIGKLAKDADVFICESTFLTEVELAKEYHHLTAEQAANYAKKAKVGKLYLYHISQRHDAYDHEYTKIARKIFKNSELAKDLLKVEV